MAIACVSKVGLCLALVLGGTAACTAESAVVGVAPVDDDAGADDAPSVRFPGDAPTLPDVFEELPATGPPSQEAGPRRVDP
jgi:hypothetical protein